MRPFRVNNLNFGKKVFVLLLFASFFIHAMFSMLECLCFWGVKKLLLKWLVWGWEILSSPEQPSKYKRTTNQNNGWWHNNFNVHWSNCPVISQMSVSTILPEVMVPPPQSTSFPTTPRVTQTSIGDLLLSYQVSRYPLVVENIRMTCQLQLW